MTLKFQKKYLVIFTIIFILIIITYQIRQRPIDNLNGYLKKNNPTVNTKEAKYVCDELKNELRKVLEYMIYTKPYAYLDITDTSTLEYKKFLEATNINILKTNPNILCIKYNIKDKNDSIKVMEYTLNSMRYVIDLRIKYLFPNGSLEDTEKNRNFIEKYFFFDF